MADPSPDLKIIAVLILDSAPNGAIGLRIPEFAIEMYGEDLPDLIEQAEELLWWKLEMSGNPVPERTSLAVRRVTKDEFGPCCFEMRAEEDDWLEDE